VVTGCKAPNEECEPTPAVRANPCALLSLEELDVALQEVKPTWLRACRVPLISRHSVTNEL
jgi:hypothetical protein